VIEKSCQVPRISSGPDIHQIILGSEGTFGVVTEATFKICPMPECKRYGSVLFHNFQNGVKCMMDVANKKCAPASIRLMDNEQFVFGQALKPGASSYWKAFSDKLKKLYITQWKGFNVKDICAMTLVFEGTKETVDSQEKKIYEIASKFGGIPAGAENGRYGYMLTYAIAYLRDLGFEYSCLGESFETSVPWDRVQALCTNVKQLLHKESKRRGVVYPVFASCRVTQVYDSGACVYFYYAFNYRDMKHPLHIYEEIEELARDEILACGGSISHHHGVGKLRKKWLPQTVGEVGLTAMKAIKEKLDPINVFANGNLHDFPAKL